MLAIILALASAIGYGGSDFAAGLASRDVSVIPVTLLATAVSSAIVAAALPFAASPEPSAAALAWGFGAGLAGTLGAFALYLGYRHAAFSVAGPLSAVAAAVVAGIAARSPGEGGAALGFRLLDRRARLLAVATGAAGATGTILFFFATHQGFLAVTAVLTSLYPAVTIMLARTVLGERLTAMRLGGLALAGVCVSLIAVGGAG